MGAAGRTAALSGPVRRARCGLRGAEGERVAGATWHGFPRAAAGVGARDQGAGIGWGRRDAVTNYVNNPGSSFRCSAVLPSAV